MVKEEYLTKIVQLVHLFEDVSFVVSTAWSSITASGLYLSGGT